MTHKERLYNAFSIGLAPEQDLDIVLWASKHVTLARSSRSDKADLNQTPWLVEPLRAILGNDHSDICLCAPVGSGKTSLLEIAVTYIVAEKPGPCLIGMMSNPDAQELMETGIKPALKNCSSIDKLWPTERNKSRKDFIQFSHMPLWVGGSNVSNFQSKSCDYVFLDEAWLLKKALLEEAKRRTHDRFNSKFVLMSQAGVIGDDFDIAINNCHKHEFCFKCPSCFEFHPYKFENLKWTSDKTETDEVIWESLVVEYVCDCGHTFKDDVASRRALADSSCYIQGDSNNPLRGHIAFHYNSLCVWWVSWKSLVIDFLKANELKKKGNVELFRQFRQKRLAEPWDDLLTLDDTPLICGGYMLSEAQRWERVFIGVDVQLDYLYYVVRTFAKSGESRLLESGKVINFSDIKAIQDRYELQGKFVFIDSAYRKPEVRENVVRHGWIGVNGRPDKDFLIKKKNSPRQTYRRLYDEPKKFQTALGNGFNVYFSSQSVKDILFILKSGNGVRWEVAEDASEDYKWQLNSEVKTMIDGKVTYKKIRKNHLLDCEVQILVGAMIYGCYPHVTLD